jgi:hypothetical protein
MMLIFWMLKIFSLPMFFFIFFIRNLIVISTSLSLSLWEIFFKTKKIKKFKEMKFNTFLKNLTTVYWNDCECNWLKWSEKVYFILQLVSKYQFYIFYEKKIEKISCGHFHRYREWYKFATVSFSTSRTLLSV